MVKPARVCQCLSGGAVMKLTNTVTNITKNNKGFSLLEVLVGVSIIGIISAIAVPTYVDYRNNAAKVASDTSAGNIAKAYKNCRVLNTSCTNLSDLKISCPAGAICLAGSGTSGFCAHIHKGDAGKNDFKVCIQVDSSNTEIRTYGGALLPNKVCQVTCTSGSGTATTPQGTVDCTSDASICTIANNGATCSGTKSNPTCVTKSNAGQCDTSSGVCS